MYAMHMHRARQRHSGAVGASYKNGGECEYRVTAAIPIARDIGLPYMRLPGNEVFHRIRFSIIEQI